MIPRLHLVWDGASAIPTATILMWGHGGQARWPTARPHYCPPRSQDHLGFLLPQWYDEVVRQQVGRSLPFICTENGPRIDDAQHPNFPVVDEARHAQISVDMIRRVLKELRAKKQVECLGRGQSAKWRKTKNWQLGNT